MSRRGLRVLNVLSLVVVGLAALILLWYLVLLVNPSGFYNPFAPQQPTETVLVVVVSPTPTDTPVPPPTWTPTSTPTMGPTSSPPPSRTPTKTPTVTPTWPPTPSPTPTPTATLTPTLAPTPRATRSPQPFTCEVTYRSPEYDNPWSGVAGYVQDQDGNPLPGYYAQVECPGAGVLTSRAGEDERFNRFYGSEAAWEQACNPTAFQAMEIRMQLFNDRPDADGTYRPVSDRVIVELLGNRSGSLGFVVCTLNWEGWQ